MLWVSSEQDSVSVLQGLVLLGREVMLRSNTNIFSTEKCYEESEIEVHVDELICALNMRLLGLLHFGTSTLFHTYF